MEEPAAGGEFGPDDQLGRLNYLTEAKTVKAAREIKAGKRFCLSLPLDVPATEVLCELGYDAAAIEALADRGVLSR